MLRNSNKIKYYELQQNNVVLWDNSKFDKCTTVKDKIYIDLNDNISNYEMLYIISGNCVDGGTRVVDMQEICINTSNIIYSNNDFSDYSCRMITSSKKIDNMACDYSLYQYACDVIDINQTPIKSSVLSGISQYDLNIFFINQKRCCVFRMGNHVISIPVKIIGIPKPTLIEKKANYLINNIPPIYINHFIKEVYYA